MRLLLLFTPFLISFTLNAQVTVPFGIEFTPQLFLVDLPESNTEASTRTSYGCTIAGIAEVNLSTQFRFESGVQLGWATFSQRVIQRNTSIAAPNNIIRSIAADATYFHAGVPLFLKYSPLGDTGPYLKAGARAQLNFSAKTSARLTDDNGNIPDDPTLFPGGEVVIPDFSLVPEVGIGFRFYGKNGLPSYLEFSCARIPGNALGYSDARDSVGRPNLFDTARGGSINVTLGARFGR